MPTLSLSSPSSRNSSSSSRRPQPTSSSSSLIRLALLLALYSPIVLAVRQCGLRPPKNGTMGGNGAVAGTADPTPTAPAGPWGTDLPAAVSFRYGTDVVRGVNLGGWFVLEPWITPSIFEATGDDDIVDEYTFGQLQDREAARQVLEDHWKTWITEDDFQEMHDAGLNHVRIPFGYWSVPITSKYTTRNTSSAPYIPGAWPYLMRALGWARLHGLHVILDLHGAPGSQNGYDNSGKRGRPGWASSDDNVQRTLDVIRFMVTQTAGMIDIIELLNEPAGFWDGVPPVIRQYWQDGYKVVRAAAGDGLHVMIGDAFLGVNAWQNFLTPPDSPGVVMDYHEYQIFSTGELSRSFDQHIAFVCNTLLPRLTSFASSNIFTIIGEWSNAVTDCTKWLNGRGVGSRWEGKWHQSTDPLGSCDGMSGNLSGFSESYKTFLRKYWEVQVELGERIQGWVFWTWKAENSDEWSYQRGLEGGWIPRNPTERKYPAICQG